jgi:hypothetical protein
MEKSPLVATSRLSMSKNTATGRFMYSSLTQVQAARLEQQRTVPGRSGRSVEAELSAARRVEVVETRSSGGLTVVGEHPLAATEQDRLDHQRVLVDEVLLDQLRSRSCTGSSTAEPA